MRDYSPSRPAPDRTLEAHPTASRQAPLEQLLQMLRPTEPGVPDMYTEDTVCRPAEFKYSPSAPPVAPASSPSKVIQRIATQVIMEGDKIRLVMVDGRPPRTHGSSMGDHTTAFCVQKEGLNLALTGKTLAEAISLLKKFGDHLNDFPSLGFLTSGEEESSASLSPVSSSPSSTPSTSFPSSPSVSSVVHSLSAHYQMQRTALDIYLSQAEATIKTGKEDQCLHFIQLAIDAYLCARELVPFTTVNVRKVSSRGGKGKGESFPLALLSDYERRLSARASSSPPPLSLEAKASIKGAIKGLFDVQAVVLLVTAEDAEEMETLSGGVNFPDTAKLDNKLSLLWTQHIRTIQFMFPKVYVALGKEIETFPPSLQIAAETKLYQRFCDTLQRINCLSRRIPRLYGEKALLSKRSKRKKQEYQEMIENDVGKMQEEITLAQGYASQLTKIREVEKGMEQAKKKLGVWENLVSDPRTSCLDIPDDEDIKLIPLKRKRTGDEDWGETLDDEDTELMPLKREKTGDENVGETEKSMEIDNPTYLPTKRVPSDEKKSTLSSEGTPMSIQIVLDERQCISSVLAEGRPPSPFSQTMGAHTTAWVVHLDRVSRRIYGMNLETAMEEIQKMDEEITQGSTEKKPEESLVTPKEEKSLLSQLQQAIYTLFAHLNMQDGTTIDKIDTTSHGEASFRKTLISYELSGSTSEKKSSPEQLRKAIRGLFDDVTRGPLYHKHRQFIAMAYPRAYAQAYPSSTTPRSSLRRASSLSAKDGLPSSVTSVRPPAAGSDPENGSVSLKTYFHTYPFQSLEEYELSETMKKMEIEKTKDDESL